MVSMKRRQAAFGGVHLVADIDVVGVGRLRAPLDTDEHLNPTSTTADEGTAFTHCTVQTMDPLCGG